MLVSDIVRRVRDIAGDTAVLQFSNATLTDWINDAIRECANENSLLQGKATSATIIGQTDYTLPPDLFKLHSVILNGMKLDFITREQWEERNAGAPGMGPVSSPPISCYVYAGVLTVSPVPDTVAPLVIFYTKLPAAISFTPGPPESWNPASPSIPEAFHNRIITYCLAQVALQDDDYNKYNAFMNQFTTGVLDLKHASQSEDDLYPFISVAGRDQGDSWPYDPFVW